MCKAFLAVVGVQRNAAIDLIADAATARQEVPDSFLQTTCSW